MTESEYNAKIKALEEALKRDQEKLTKLQEKHKADKALIHNLKRRKDAKDKVKPAAEKKRKPRASAKKKEEMPMSVKPLGLSALQKERLEELFPGITSMSSLFD